MDVALRRLRAQRLSGPGLPSPTEVVGWLGAVQSQDYAGACWALGLRSAGATAAALDELFDAGRILRTHVLRPTWHFVLAEDVRALIQLTGPRVLGSTDHRRRFLELDEATVTSAFRVFERELGGGRHLTRRELARVLERAGISPDGQRVAHLVLVAELQGLVISGPRKGREFTYALLEERVPARRQVSREEALARLTLTYFRSHGPAGPQDFAWWSGLTLREARAGIAAAGSELDHASGHHWVEQAEADPGEVHLLPNWDEYTVAYRDRSALDGPDPFDPSLFAFGSVLSNVLTVGGRVRGAWRLRGGRLEVRLLGRLSLPELAGVEAAAAELGRFTGRSLELALA